MGGSHSKAPNNLDKLQDSRDAMKARDERHLRKSKIKGNLEFVRRDEAFLKKFEHLTNDSSKYLKPILRKYKNKGKQEEYVPRDGSYGKKFEYSKNKENEYVKPISKEKQIRRPSIICTEEEDGLHIHDNFL